jgi:ribosome-binding factor A
MDSTRQLKVSRLIQKELGTIFQRDARNMFGPVMITVTQVRVSPDLGVAKVYVSLFPVKDKEAVLTKIKTKTIEIRKTLGEQIKKQVRVIPNLMFFLDDSLDYAEHIDDLLKKQ